ncbi:MAG: hypothetical protein GY738_12905 [Pseudoalteromonas sp.]|nr:hypothetical protein [Pseudoalteromonas sp.]
MNLDHAKASKMFQPTADRPRQNQSRIKVGSSLDQGWIRVGSSLDQGWIKLGSRLDQGWIRVGSSLDQGRMMKENVSKKL